jgi:hypothetical protein
VGIFVGDDVGFFVGSSVGDAVGCFVGVFVGASVGTSVGESVGESVGDSVGFSLHSLCLPLLQRFIFLLYFVPGTFPPRFSPDNLYSFPFFFEHFLLHFVQYEDFGRRGALAFCNF